MFLGKPQPTAEVPSVIHGVHAPAVTGPEVGRAGGEPAAGPCAGMDADRRYGELLAGVRFQPVFIMGDHRSGTTLLYQLLAQTGHFNVVTAYHVIYYGEIVSNYLNGTEAEAKRALSRRLADHGQTDRLFDDVSVTPDLPEEYGFVLSNRHSGQGRLDPQTLPTFVELCRKVQLTAGVDR